MDAKLDVEIRTADHAVDGKIVKRIVGGFYIDERAAKRLQQCVGASGGDQGRRA